MTWHRTPEEQGQSRLRNWHQRNPSHQHVGFIAPSREPRNRTRPAPVAHAPRRRTSYRGQGTQLGPGEVAGAYHSGPPWPGNSLIALAAERAPLRKASPATGRLAEYSRARAAQHHGLRVGEHGGAAWGRQAGGQKLMALRSMGDGDRPTRTSPRLHPQITGRAHNVSRNHAPVRAPSAHSSTSCPLACPRKPSHPAIHVPFRARATHPGHAKRTC